MPGNRTPLFNYFLVFLFDFPFTNSTTETFAVAFVRLAQNSKTKKPTTVQPRKRFKKNTETLLRTPLINAIINGIKYAAMINNYINNCQKPMLINLI